MAVIILRYSSGLLVNIQFYWYGLVVTEHTVGTQSVHCAQTLTFAMYFDFSR